MRNSNLNREQQIAVESEGNVLLVACPGSGKTHTLIYKIANELESIDTHRQFVVALTYTNVAADEIRERIRSLGVNTEQLWIGTIHSFCLEWIINPYYIYHDKLKHGFRVIDTKEGEDLLDTCAKNSGLRSRYDCDHYVVPESSIFSCKTEHARQAIIAYHDQLNKKHAIDFQLLLRYAYELIRDRKEIAERLNRYFLLLQSMNIRIRSSFNMKYLHRYSKQIHHTHDYLWWVTQINLSFHLLEVLLLGIVIFRE